MANAFLEDLSKGLVLVDSDAVRQSLRDAFSRAFGTDINTTTETSLGQLIEVLTAARYEQVQGQAAFINAVLNPNSAQGPMLDNLVAVLGVNRRPATKSSVSLLFTGTPGTQIPYGTLVQVQGGDTFSTRITVSIGPSGTVLAEAESVEFGAVQAPSGALTELVAAVEGVDSVTNPDAATVGQDEQTDADLRNDFKGRQGVFGFGTVFALKAAMQQTSGVRSFSFLENTEATSQVIRGVTMPPKSIYFCVQGGTDTAVAQSIIDKKPPGANWCHGNGVNKTVTVADSVNILTYNVLFDRPTPVNVELMLKVRQTGGTLNTVNYVKNLVLDLFQNNTRAYVNDPTWGVGVSVAATLVGTAVAKANDALSVIHAVARARTSLGEWDAATNTPTLDPSANNTNIKNRFYVVSVAGNTTLNGVSSWAVNDIALWDGTKFIKIANTSGAVDYASIPYTCDEIAVYPWEYAVSSNSFVNVTVVQ